MGWGPVDWVGRLPPEAKFEIKCTSFFYFFGFERPLLRYLSKTVLHCKGSGIWVNAITLLVTYLGLSYFMDFLGVGSCFLLSVVANCFNERGGLFLTISFQIFCACCEEKDEK